MTQERRKAMLLGIADEEPDIIFVDIMMPRLDGYQTCALIKHNQVFKKTPVIMLSSKDGLFDKAASSTQPAGNRWIGGLSTSFAVGFDFQAGNGNLT